jgi:molybdate/tungstate transport system substrate-binding protein
VLKFEPALKTDSDTATTEFIFYHEGAKDTMKPKDKENHKKLRKILRLCVFVVLLSLTLGACSTNDKKTLSIFIAGSLIVPFDELEQAYEVLHPEVDVRVEAHGSIQCVRHVTEIHDLIDVLVPADYALIPMLMYASSVPETGRPYADWYIKFASNEVVLAYTPDSQSADEITQDNWYEIIARPDVKFGLSDPRLDAAGYRSLMIVQLAENFYGDPTIFERVYLGRFREPMRVEKFSEQQIIHVPELLETNADSNIVLRGGSIALLALLESGDVDYAFEYKSVARQHGLRYVKLPPEINLGDQTWVENYALVQVQLDFQRFASVTPVFDGEVVGYGVTIPSNAPNPEDAQKFVEFLLGSEGVAIMDRNNHPMFAELHVDHCAALPETLKPFCDK